MTDLLDFVLNHALLPLLLGAVVALLVEAALAYERRPWHVKRTSRYESPLWRWDE